MRELTTDDIIKKLEELNFNHDDGSLEVKVTEKYYDPTKLNKIGLPIHTRYDKKKGSRTQFIITIQEFLEK